MDLLLNTHNFRLFRVLFSLAKARHALLLLSRSLSRHIFFLLCDTFIYIYITACARLSRRNGDFALRRRQITSLQFICRQQRPASRLPHAIQSHRDVDDDFTFGRLLRFFVLLDVRSAGVADPAGGVQKADTRNGKLTQVFQVPVDDQVRQTVSAAEQTSFAVVLEARVGFVDGRLQSQRRSGFRVVFLHALCETFDFLLVVLLEGFVCLARRQTGVWLHVSGKRGVDRHRGRDDGGGDERGGFLRRIVSAARDGDIRLLGGRLLRLQVRGRGDLQSLSFALKKKRKVRVSDFLSSRRSKVVQSVRDARARIEIRDDAMRDIREEMAILNHARSSQSRVSSFAWPDFGPRAVRFQAARVRLTDPPARAAFFSVERRGLQGGHDQTHLSSSSLDHYCPSRERHLVVPHRRRRWEHNDKSVYAKKKKGYDITTAGLFATARDRNETETRRTVCASENMGRVSRAYL